MAVFLVVSVSSANNYAKEQQFRKLLALRQRVHAIVRRNGDEKYINASQLLVGDVIAISQGDQLPADCILLHAPSALAVNESALTGELRLIFKFLLTEDSARDRTDPFLKTGSMVEEGSGEGVVCVVGENTELGRIHVLISEETREPSPLQRKLGWVADCICLYCNLTA